MRRGKDTDWNVYDSTGNTDWNKVSIVVLMDIRDELKQLNAVLHCGNFQRIPYVLDKVVSNTRPKRKKRVAKS